MLKKLIPTFLIIFLVFISYGQTLKMYFWQDDNALIFKLQNPAGPAGSWGAGYFGSGPYKYTVTPFFPFYRFFELNPFGYFLVGFILYILTTAVFYLFAKTLFKNNKYGFLATVIFAAGYIGSDTMFRISNSWQTNMGLIVAILSFWSLVKFKQQKLFRYYLLSLGLFYFAIQFIYIRSHSIVFPIFIIDLILSLPLQSVYKFLKLFIRQLPFWILFYIYYIQGESSGSDGISFIIKELLKGKIEVLSALFGDIGNVLVASEIQNKIITVSQKPNILLFFFFIIISQILNFSSKTSLKIKAFFLLFMIGGFYINKHLISQNFYWYRSPQDILSGEIGILGSIFIFNLAFIAWKKHKEIIKILIIGYSILISQIFGYFIKYQDAIFTTTHRYFSYSFIGYCLLFVSIVLIYSKRKILAATILFLIIFPNLILGFNYQNNIVKSRSDKTREFYQTLTSQVKAPSKGSTFYFDIASDSVAQNQFNNSFSVGSMPESTALAIYYGLDRDDVKLITNNDELLYNIESGQIDPQKTYFFFYNKDGLINQTNLTRSLLNNGSEPEKLNIKNTDTNSINLSPRNIKPLTQMVLNLNMSVYPNLSISYPYGLGESGSNLEQKLSIIDYLLARRDYYSQVSASSLSEWKYQEINYIVDNNTSTSWRGHRIYWNDHNHDQVTLDLGSVKNIGRLLWINWNHTLTPISYTIQGSLDNQTWQILKTVTNGPERGDGEAIIDSFAGTNVRFIRMDITKTVDNDSPAIEEMEAIESKFNYIDPIQAQKFISSPFNGIQNQEEMQQLIGKIGPLLNFEVKLDTDKAETDIFIPVSSFNQYQSYQVILPSGGTAINSIIVTIPNAPLSLDVTSATLSNLNFQQIKQMSLIKNISSN